MPGSHSWQATLELAPGDNLISVTATDPGGNLGRKTIKVTLTPSPDVTAPTLSSTIPADGETGVSTNSALVIRFSEAMNASSLNALTVVLKDSLNNAISGNVSVLGDTATFAPAASLSASTSYTASIGPGAQDLAGNHLAVSYVWTFTTGLAPDLTAPTVVSTSPANAATCVPTETGISVGFSEPVPSQSLNSNSFVLLDALNNPISGSVVIDNTGAGNFLPGIPLANSTIYTGKLTTELTDLSGNHLTTDYLWNFTTQAAGSGNWSSTPVAGAPTARSGHTAVWTGSEMIVWGGGYGDGARYQPQTDRWSSLSAIGAPESRSGHVAVWTGSRMIIWGGVRPGAFLNSGELYDPATDTWSAMSIIGAPSARQLSSAVWTGSEMIVWGGDNGGGTGLNDGARYNPATDVWSPLSSVDAPAGRYLHTAVWTGSTMLVWGGSGLNSGGIYTPSTNSWTALPLANAPSARSAHSAIWTGSEMIVWGGQNASNPLGTGARFNPNSNSWQPLTTTCGPSARYGHVGVWSGTEMLVWGGGLTNGPHYEAGGRYNPDTDIWQPIPVIGQPGARIGLSGIWDGSGLIVWGGRDVLGIVLGNGGRYQP
jgi:N-acetylneuraminic acid mutarotase